MHFKLGIFILLLFVYVAHTVDTDTHLLTFLCMSKQFLVSCLSLWQIRVNETPCLSLVTAGCQGSTCLGMSFVVDRENDKGKVCLG